MQNVLSATTQICIERGQTEISTLADDIRPLGFPCLKYMYAPNLEAFDHPEVPKFVLLANMPPHPGIDWQLSGGNDDPLRGEDGGLEAFCTGLPILWSAENGNLHMPDKPLTEDQETCLSLLLGTGLNAGVVVPIHTQGRGVAVISYYVPEGSAFVGRLGSSVVENLFLASYTFHNQITDIVARWTAAIYTAKLTPRETECLQWSVYGKSSWEIAKILYLSHDTVRDYLKHAAQKLDCVTRPQAVAKAIQMGLIDVDKNSILNSYKKLSIS